MKEQSSTGTSVPQCQSQIQALFHDPNTVSLIIQISIFTQYFLFLAICIGSRLHGEDMWSGVGI